MTKIILHGCLGAMGQAVLRSADEYDTQIVAGISGGEPAPGAHFTAGFPTFGQIADCDMKADVIIDFSLADAVTPLLKFAREKKLPAVICTTGLTPEQEDEITETAKIVPIFHSSNMSLGISLLTTVLKRVSRLLYESGFDIEILEKHHNRKIDAPSGTAWVLAASVNAALDNKLEPVFDRSPRRERRGREELGMSSIRGGTICGEHSVIFAGNEEVIELRHSAFSREIYAVGALNAAKYIKDKPPGLYTMENIINLEEL
ncbi:MAG: 4-hydroxy-tetrahydrodipicolinate reductase [Defluviitaleaceae bacterium]|nr:4-hydroxy-tetrahydrodipicolinate reductase [Defluviitaleaceae bacterium]